MKPTLGIAPASVTHYPEPCIVCHQAQCEYDLRHIQYFSLKLFLEEQSENMFKKKPQDDALQEQLENMLKKKPPDDASGIMVATHKEPTEASSKF